MKHPALASTLLIMVLMLTACERDAHEPRGTPLPTDQPQGVALTSLRPGGATSPPPLATPTQYQENAYQISQGARLFVWFNCNGCHANGGGGMGPPLMDDQWIYGGEPAQIYATIHDGRPNGMPAFQGKVPDQQIWQLVAYVRALSGQVRKDVAPSRRDDMFPHASEQSLPAAQPVQGGSLPPAAERPP